MLLRKQVDLVLHQVPRDTYRQGFERGYRLYYC